MLLICDNCKVYYEIEEDLDLDSFDICETCGNKLKLYNSFDDYYNENDEPQRESMVIGKGYSEKKSSHYNSIMIIGALISFIGLLGFILSSKSIIVFLLGMGLIYYGYNNGKSWNKGIKGESIVAEYLNQLPKDYYIFNDVKFPGSYGNLDHVIIGPTGIYVIETKNYSGFFLVRDKEWFYKSGSHIERARGQPGEQVIKNAMSLRRFLINKGVDMDGVWVNSIVTLLDNNFKIEEKPRNYNVLFPSTIPQFILNSNRNVDVDILKDVAVLIEPYCIELSYSQSDM